MDKIEFNFNPLRGKIREVLKTEAQLASSVGLDASNLSQKLNGKVSFSISEIYAIMSALNLPIEDVHKYFFKLSD